MVGKLLGYLDRYRSLGKVPAESGFFIEYLYRESEEEAPRRRHFPVYLVDPTSQKLSRSHFILEIAGFPPGDTVTSRGHRRASPPFDRDLKDLSLNDGRTIEVLQEGMDMMTSGGNPRFVLVHDQNSHNLYICNVTGWQKYEAQRERSRKAPRLIEED